MDRRHNPHKVSIRSGLAARSHRVGDRVRASQIFILLEPSHG